MPAQICLPCKLLINSTMAALLATPIFSQALSRQPEVDGELVVTYTEQSNVSLSVMPQAHRVPFRQSLFFHYGIKAGSGHPSEPGAIVVKVTKVYSQGTDEDWEYAKKTTLYRNDFTFPEVVEGFDDEIDRDRYINYHNNKFYTSNRLERQFHVLYRVNEKTNQPLSRRKGFLHEGSGDPSKVVAQGSYMFSYEGIRPQGTWIPFNLRFQGDFSEVYITIIDFGIDSAGDPVGKTWHFVAEK